MRIDQNKPYIARMKSGSEIAVSMSA